VSCWLLLQLEAGSAAQPHVKTGQQGWPSAIGLLCFGWLKLALNVGEYFSSCYHGLYSLHTMSGQLV